MEIKDGYGYYIIYIFTHFRNDYKMDDYLPKSNTSINLFEEMPTEKVDVKKLR